MKGKNRNLPQDSPNKSAGEPTINNIKNSHKNILSVPGETIEDEDNPFSEKGFKILVISDLDNIDAEIKSLQKSTFLLKKDILRLESEIIEIVKKKEYVQY